MNTVRKLTLAGLLAASVLVSVSPTLARKVNEYEGQHRYSVERKVNEYEGQHRKVNEYEGQHRKVNEYEGQH